MPIKYFNKKCKKCQKTSYVTSLEKKCPKCGGELEKVVEPTYTPKCPLCGSPNIRKISDMKKATHAVAFGLFSNTARSQWECLNCKNKF